VADTEFTLPTVVTAAHDVLQFNSGEGILDDWLRDRALENLANGASRTYVTSKTGERRVAAYYALSMGSVASGTVPGSMRRNMPRAIPVVILGRLAVDQGFQGHGLGAKMLHDATIRTMRAASEVSARLLLVHAISARAEAFYQHHGFTRIPGESELPTLALDLIKLAKMGGQQ
jgi:GNAT superfamily N-acetyltransferase